MTVGDTRAMMWRRAPMSITVTLVCALAASCAEGGTVTAVASKASTSIASRASTTTASGSSTAADPTGDTAVGITEPTHGNAFTDPEGNYTIRLGPDWTEAPTRPVAKVEQWVVAPATDGFAPNVNVLTQDVPGMTLQDYIDVSLDGMGRLDVLDSAVIDLDDGSELGRIEYAGTLGTGTNRRALHFVAIFAVADDEAVVATLTVGENDFEELRLVNEPYLRTLRHR